MRPAVWSKSCALPEASTMMRPRTVKLLRHAALRQTCYRLGVKIVAALVAAICFPLTSVGANEQWVLVRSSHFAVYSHADEPEARSVAVWLEQLRAFFATTLLPGRTLESHGPVRIIEFRSIEEYAAFQLRPAADAYFVGGAAADYIVMPRLGAEEFRITAHEYAHLVVHSLGLRLPPWLSEGIAELFSTVRIGEGRCFIGADLPVRTLTLRKRPWIALPQLLELTEDAPLRQQRKQAEMFYAESWALTHMLVFSPAYAAHFGQLWTAIAAGPLNADILARIYGKPVTAILADLQTWLQQPKSGLPLPGVPAPSEEFQVSILTSLESRMSIADLLLASGDLNRAEAAYSALAKQRPDDPVPVAALGTIALRRNQQAKAREQWKLAMQLGIADAELCYQYAILAEEAGMPNDEIAGALRRAIHLRQDFDDARYKLALLESNCGHYEAALEQFRSMRSVPLGRAYAYWIALASALAETDQRQQAKDAAYKAVRYARSAEERASALQLAYVADTDLTVQFARDATGALQMVTARKPHGAGDWNPFIEPGDHIVSLTGQIRKVECTAGNISGFRIRSTSATVEVTLPDPAHVMIGGGTAEFVCGTEDGRRVAIQYALSEKHQAADGVLRAMQFQ